MSKYFMLVTLIISAFFHAENDFDWRGISAGMTKEQVEEYTGCSGGAYCSMDETDAFFESKGFSKPANLLLMRFAYTAVSEELWRISLSFRESSGAERVAQMQLLSKYYPDSESQKSRTNIGSYRSPINVDTDVRLIIDDARFTSDIDAILKRDEPTHN